MRSDDMDFDGWIQEDRDLVQSMIDEAELRRDEARSKGNLDAIAAAQRTLVNLRDADRTLRRMAEEKAKATREKARVVLPVPAGASAAASDSHVVLTARLDQMNAGIQEILALLRGGGDGVRALARR